MRMREIAASTKEKPASSSSSLESCRVVYMRRATEQCKKAALKTGSFKRVGPALNKGLVMHRREQETHIRPRWRPISHKKSRRAIAEFNLKQFAS